MKNLFKVLIVNFVLFLVIVTTCENFFVLNRRYHLISNKIISNLKLIPFEQHVTFLDKKKFLDMYGPTIFQIPIEYKSGDIYPQDDGTFWKRAVPQFAEVNSSDYMVRLKGHLNKNKNFIATDYILKDNFKKKLYEVSYNFDENGLRRTTSKPVKPNATYIMALGDSFTIGEGVSSNANYPYLLDQKLDSSFKVENFGFHSYGINDLLYEVQQNSKLFEHLKGKSTVAIWLFIRPHLERGFCHTQCFRDYDYIREKPRFLFNDGKLVLDGTFSSSTSLEMVLRRVLARSATLQFFNFDFPLSYSDEELKLFVKMFAEVRSYIQRNSKLKDFYFVNYFDFPERKRLLVILKEQGFKILDYADINFEEFFENQKIPYDSHPTPEAYWVLTELLKKDIFNISETN